MIEETIEVVNFINRLHDCLKIRQRVRVNMRNVKTVTPDGIVVLVSLLIRFKNSRIAYICDLPKDGKCREQLKASGFIDHLFKQHSSFRESYMIRSKSTADICTHAMRCVDSELTSQLISQATTTIWGKKRRSQGTQRAFIELMMNTNNHASPYRQGEKLWWLSVNHSKAENKVRISFVDYGVGIFTSLKKKQPGTKFYGAYETMKQFLGIDKSDAKLLEHILNGELHKTVTGKDYRGKGLPGIYQAMGRNFYSKLHIITNNVRANVEGAEYEEINTNFAGTFIYLEISKENLSYDGVN